MRVTYLFLVTLVVVVLFLCVNAWRLVTDARWEAYKAKHACRPAPYIVGDTDLAREFRLTGRYTPPTYTGPSQQRWLCNNGKVFTR